VRAYAYAHWAALLQRRQQDLVNEYSCLCSPDSTRDHNRPFSGSSPRTRYLQDAMHREGKRSDAACIHLEKENGMLACTGISCIHRECPRHSTERSSCGTPLRAFNRDSDRCLRHRTRFHREPVLLATLARHAAFSCSAVRMLVTQHCQMVPVSSMMVAHLGTLFVADVVVSVNTFAGDFVLACCHAFQCVRS